jgi:hypothetical protein
MTCVVSCGRGRSYGTANTPDQFRGCDRLLTIDQKQRVIARAGI